VAVVEAEAEELAYRFGAAGRISDTINCCSMESRLHATCNASTALHDETTSQRRRAG